MARIQEKTDRFGNKYYPVTIRLKGFPTICNRFDRKTDAKKWAQKTESDLRYGRAFPYEQVGKKTLSDLIDRYLLEVLPRKAPSTQAVDRYRLNWWKQEYGGLRLRDFTSDKINQAKTRLKEERGNGPNAVNLHLANIGNVLERAVRWKWLYESPMRGVEKELKPEGRTRCLQRDEIPRLLSACKQSCSPFLYAAVILSLYTGMRRGELLGLTWDRVDLNTGYITLNKTKNKKSRVTVARCKALELLRHLNQVRRIDTKLVFPSKEGRERLNFRKAFLNALRVANIEDFHWHDLRHTHASLMKMSCGDERVVQSLLGHSSPEMTRKYIHSYSDFEAQLVEAMIRENFEKENAV